MPGSDSGPKPARHLVLGAEGEARAEAHLRARGYRIADRNVRVGGVELDLVAERAGTLVFVEVKTRRARTHGGGEAAVGWQKRRRLARGARAWLDAHRGRRYRSVRFDVIAWCVEAPDSDTEPTWHVTHYEGAFEAGD